MGDHGRPARPPASPVCSATRLSLGFEMPVAQLVLAGGQGTRIGGGKPNRVLGGRTLLDHALSRIDPEGGPIALSVRRSGDPISHLPLIVDEPGVEGPLAGLIAGLSWAQSCGLSWLHIRPCDAPYLPCDLAQRLLEAAILAGTPAALPESHERLHPACGLWNVELARLAAARATNAKRSLIGLALDAGYAVASWGAPAPDPFLNINTLEDLAQAEAALAASR